MIHKIHIEEWQNTIPWPGLEMVEQDLVISKALVCLFRNPRIKEQLIFRGGTALNKLFLDPPARYSEDLDFVQRKPEPIGKTFDEIRSALDPWLGRPNRRVTEHGAKLTYRYTSINQSPMKLKIEVNMSEHLQILGIKPVEYAVNSQWFKDQCTIHTFHLEELMATKLRALFQRRKGRDLFDVWHVFSKKLADVEVTLKLFDVYCKHNKTTISKKEFYENLLSKKLNSDFRNDISPLISTDTYWNFDEAFEYVQSSIISKLAD